MTSLRLTSLFAAIAVSVATLASAQEIVRKEAPPEIRTLFQAFTQAANGDAAAWESFAQAHYTDALLKQQTAAQCAEFHQKLADRFGKIAVNGVRVEGPDGPLQVMVKGEKAEGTVLVDLDLASPKIFAISLQ